MLALWRDVLVTQAARGLPRQGCGSEIRTVGGWSSNCNHKWKAPRGGRLSTGCGGSLLTPRRAGRVSVASRMPCLGPGREGMGITSLGRDAQGLTFSAVIPARVMQPGESTRGKQNWRIALCGYGMTLAPRHRVHLCVSHRWRTSAVRTGSGDPWPDSGGG